MHDCCLLLLLIIGQCCAAGFGVNKANLKFDNDILNDIYKLEAVIVTLAAKNDDLERRVNTVEQENRRLIASLAILQEKYNEQERWNTGKREKALQEKRNKQEIWNMENSERDSTSGWGTDIVTIENYGKEDETNVSITQSKVPEEALDITDIAQNKASKTDGNGNIIKVAKNKVKANGDNVNAVNVADVRDEDNTVAGDLSSNNAANIRSNRRIRSLRSSLRSSTVSAHGQGGQQTVAFTTVISEYSLSNLHSNQAIVFDKIITNIGNAYSNITGVFTAPVTGVYVFNFAVMVEPGDNEYIELVDDGMQVMCSYVTAVGESRYISSSRTATLHVAHGSEIWVRAYHGSNIIHGNGYTTFSGWLVSSTN